MSAPVRRWPLIFIAAPAAVAIWSGWVGLGGMCGFGLVQPLPGIVPWHLNTAITLPVGVEAYGAYALGVWMRPSAIPDVARRFARRSAVGALALGMTGQVIFHLLAAAHAHRAPWPVTVLVSCLPVIVLGFGAGLTHLLRADEAEQEDKPELEPETAPELPKPAVATDAESAAKAALAATITAGNPLSQNQLVTRFGLTRPVASKLRAELIPEPAPFEAVPRLHRIGEPEPDPSPNGSAS
jgi:hypothetical protein